MGLTFVEPKDSNTTEPLEDGHHSPDVEAAKPSVQFEGKDPGPPPNGGLVAWLHVLGGFMLFFNAWGILNAFGVFQTYYESGKLFTESSSNISWVGTIQGILVTLAGFIIGPIFDRGYFRTLLAVGTFCVVFGHMMLSICKTYWQVLLAQGFCVGIGASCLFVPCVSILPMYFTSHLGLAVGLASAGSSIGGIIYPVAMANVINKIGFAWSVRVVGFIAFGTLLIPLTVMHMRVKPKHVRSTFEKESLTDLPYVLTAIAVGIGSNGLMILYFYISFFPESLGVIPTGLKYYMVAIFNIGSIFGRTLPNALSDKIGAFNIVVPSAVGAALMSFCMLAVHNTAGMIVIAICAGFFSGVFIAMPAVCFAHLTPNKAKLGTRVGMGYFASSLLSIPGGPGAGAILRRTASLNWPGLWSYGGAMFAASGIIFLVVRIMRSGWKVVIKA